MVRMAQAIDTFATRAAALDADSAASCLARFRAEFVLPPGCIYLDSNSLGPLSRRAQDAVVRAIAQWGALGINGWTEADPPWTQLTSRAAARLAPLIGAHADEVIVAGGTTVNLHQLLATFYDPAHDDRHAIIGLAGNFPSDTHALASHLLLRGRDPAKSLRLVAPRADRMFAADDIVATFAPDVQMALLPDVLFTTGQLLDVAAITREAHARGILIGWDLAHGIGSVPVELGGDDGPDFAFWCSYKWLNGGPGCAGGLFLHRRHHGIRPGMAGWWGVPLEKRFAMAAEHEPAAGAEALHIGTPSILGTAPLDGALELFEEAGGVAPLRAKSIAQTSLIIEMADALGIGVATPRDPAARGGHVALTHPDAWRVCQALRVSGVVPDYRPPDIIRLAPSPFFTRFAEIVAAMRTLKLILNTRSHEAFPIAANSVT
ncbi:MAG TPA: kynureninase [Opitutaceae bacterium]|nr:kynureninase [Opitutaceae bacterium]